jgi:hypothetical protein
MSYYPPSIRPNGFIQTEKKTTKITKIGLCPTKNKKMDMIGWVLITAIFMWIWRGLRGEENNIEDHFKN